MSAPSVWIRCRDASFLRDPVFVFEEGFVCINASGSHELVLWVSDGPLSTPDPFAILTQMFGPLGFQNLCVMPMLTSLSCPPKVTGFRPPTTRPHLKDIDDPKRLSMTWLFQLRRRIPRPTASCGHALRVRNCSNGVVLDLPADPRDAYELEIG